MVALWVVIGLVIAATAVSIFGAAFSVLGLGLLFTGAAKAVMGMAAALEFAKFVLAAYLHQRWKFLNFIFKSYLTSAVVILSLITSIGIFGYLSDAYQSASKDLETETIKLTNLKSEQQRNEAEIVRLNRSVDEIPANRVTKRIQVRAEIEPEVNRLVKRNAVIETQIGEANLQILKVKQKVGPLLYIARAFNLDIDTVVKYQILLFVLVFDPLAICLVIATSEAIDSRKRKPSESSTTTTSLSMEPVAPTANEEIIQMSFVAEENKDTKVA